MPGNTATIILKADSKGVRKGTDDLKKLDRQADKTERSSKKLAKSFGTMAAVAGTAAVAIGTVFTRAVLKNTIEQDHAVAQLNASLESTGRYTDEASQALREHAAALQQNSTFADENIIAMQSQLLTFKQLGGEVLPRTTQAVLDLSTKMDQGLKESAVQLGKALNDPVANLGALGRVGIQFSKDQKVLIKTLAETGRLAEAQAIILDELESEFGGAAKAARDTLGGAIKALKNNFGDLLEVSGDGSSGLTGAINELADTLADPAVKQGFQDLAAGALEFLEVIIQMPATVGFLKDELFALFGVIDNADLVRLTDKMADLNEELAEAEGANFFGLVFEEKARVVREEIRQTQNLLDEIEAKARDKTKSTVAPAAAVAAAIPAVLGDTEPKGPSASDLKKDEDTRLKALDDRKKAVDTLRDSLREFAAEQGGAVVEANQAYEDSLAAINEQEKALLETGGITKEQEAALQELREAALITKQQTIDLIQQEIEAKNALITPTEQLIADLEFENSLIGLSNVEREKAIALKQVEGEATTQQKDKISELITEQNRLMEQQQLMNELGGSLANNIGGFFDDIADGSKTAKEAFADMAKSIIADIIKIIIQQQLMKAFGGGGGTATGGFLDALLGAGRATGGQVTPGMLHPVGEIGPELLDVGNKQYLIPDQRGGNVIPLNAGKAGNKTTNITVNLPPSIKRMTAQQTATEIGRIQNRAATRNK